MTKTDLEQLIALHGNAIYQFCYHLTGTRDDADDLYQETLCKAYEIRKKMKKPEDASTFEKERNYCMGIAVRLYKNLYRKKIKRTEESLDDGQSSNRPEPVSDFNTEEFVEKSQMQLQLRNSIRNLPLKQRTVVYLFYFADMSVKEIGSLLRIPEGTVKSRLNTAKKALKKKMEEIGYE